MKLSKPRKTDFYTLKKQRVEYLRSIIEEEKESIKDFVDQNCFTIAKSIIERIEKIRDEINSLK